MVANQLEAVRDRIAAAADRADRPVESVTLVAVSKGQPIASILKAYESGQRHFGENRAAELAAKAPELPGDIVWHFIGTLQTRQVKVAAPHTALLHSLDRPRLINTWASVAPGTRALLQVNVAGERQKHGAHPDEVAALLQQAVGLGIGCVGLMTMPPLVIDAEANRPWFQRLRTIRNALQPDYPALTELSMGMTDDFEVAIEEGATIIRVGRAIFGPPGATE